MSKRPESVLLGRDYEALNILLPLHAIPEPRILDATCNAGRMWKGTPYKPVRMDIDPSHEPDVCGDFRQMPFADSSFDVVVFDPPHMSRWTPARAPWHCRDYNIRFGLQKINKSLLGDNITPLFRPFLREARRVLKPDGIVLAKLIDYVNNHRYQWQHVDFVLASREVGMTPCDLLIKRDPSGHTLQSGKWKAVHHLRRAHCFWFVIRNSKRCERRRVG